MNESGCLIAREPPLIQVLSLPVSVQRRQAPPNQGLFQLGDILREAAGFHCVRQHAHRRLPLNVALWAEIRRLSEIKTTVRPRHCPAIALLAADSTLTTCP